MGEDHVRLGLSLGYQAAWTTPADHLAMAQEADRLGFAVAWSAEAYGSDTVSMLAWIAGQTRQIDLGAAVMQIPARTPAMTAMTAATIDALSGGRFRLGLGVSGPQVSEGWHGVRFGKPLQRTREYVDIVKMAIAREPVSYQGSYYTLPLPDGPGKALKLGFHPPRSGRRTWSWPARSPTAGWRSSSHRTRRGSTCSTSSAAGPSAGWACPASTWRRPCPW
jgi:alkanesulfonate monooxygenase SsuD/methylene tetrahydromethanopterin reductase-like flavin-dependent oxidoreductase (luciferase family)